MSTTPESAVQITGKYLTVALADEAYGVSVLKVREIIRLQKITPVPQLPDHVRGVINLRGRVIPVVDLRKKFTLPAEDTTRTCIVVVHVLAAGGRPLQMGLVVDAVEEVVNLTGAEIEPVPEFGAAIDTRYLLGIAKVKDQVKMLLNIDRVVGQDDLPVAA